MYLLLKYIHVGCVILSLSGFVARGILMLRGSPLLAARWLRIVPHVLDTLLLASAIALAFMIRQAPITHDWLTAKLFGLLAYIIFGVVALRRGKTPTIRLAAFVASLCAAAYVVSVALTRNPRGFLTWI